MNQETRKVSRDVVREKARQLAKEDNVTFRLALATCIGHCMQHGIEIVSPNELATNKVAGDYEDTVLRDPRKMAA